LVLRDRLPVANTTGAIAMSDKKPEKKGVKLSIPTPIPKPTIRPISPSAQRAEQLPKLRKVPKPLRDEKQNMSHPTPKPQAIKPLTIKPLKPKKPI
jgi:hypothetical protein